MISTAARRYRLQMRWRAWWHEVTLGGWFTALVGFLVGTLAAWVVLGIEKTVWLEWCVDTRFAKYCQVSTALTYQIEFGVAFGIIAMVGVVFTIILVSLQLVSGQFSPRLLQMVFQERRARYLIASLAGIFAFSMWSLITSVLLVEGDSVAGLGPLLVASAGLAGGILMVVLLYGVARQQYIGTILERSARQTMGLVDSMLEQASRESKPPSWFSPGALTDATTLPGLGVPHMVACTRPGWVQQISMEGLLRAGPDNCVLRLETRVGAFVVQGQPLVTAWPRSRERFDPDETAALDNVVRLAIYLGTNRTMQDDVDFGIRQITDVALKALSPAVNDPSTAIEAILRTSTVLRHILTAGLPDQIHFNRDADVLVLHPWDLDAGEYVTHAFGQIRAAAADQPAVVICLMRTMTMLQDVATTELARIEGRTDRTAASPRIEGVSHEWHLREALQQLQRQQRLALEQFEARQHPDDDVAYVRSALPVEPASD